MENSEVQSESQIVKKTEEDATTPLQMHDSNSLLPVSVGDKRTSRKRQVDNGGVNFTPRRSPRFTSHSNVPQNGNLKMELASVKVMVDGASIMSSQKPLRSSPRFSLSITPGLNIQPLITSCQKNKRELANLLEKPLRRSPKMFTDKGVHGKSSQTNSETRRLDLKVARTLESGSLTSPSYDDDGIQLNFEACLDSVDFEMRNGKCLIELPMPAEGCFPMEEVKEQHLLPNQQNKSKGRSLIGDPVPTEQAQERWHWRYEIKDQRSKNHRLKLDEDDDDEDKIVWNVESHYTQAKIDGCIFELGDCAHIKGENDQKHIGKIVEFFRTMDGEEYFRVQWYYKPEDTVMKEGASFHDEKRVFLSTVMNDNPIDCILSKIKIIQITPRFGLKQQKIPPCDFYFDMEYCVDYSTFRTLITDNAPCKQALLLHDSYDTTSGNNSRSPRVKKPNDGDNKSELSLLDLYSGCGGMSSGLSLGAKLSGLDLVVRWAIDTDKSACDSVKLNKPESHVRNEAAEDFLQLLKEWEMLCKRYKVNEARKSHLRSSSKESDKANNSDGDDDVAPGEFEVSSIVDICYGDPNRSGKHGLNLKVHWRGYSSDEDTWEPIDSLSNCQQCIREFVINGAQSRILPLPGDVDVICGGPPCQGVSGYNRFRNVDSPLDDERNRQVIVFMDIVKFLRPRFVLMENVVDILKFDKGSLARYAISRLVHMRYQARLGIMAAGCYGLPQFRLRVFLWGAQPSESLPQFPYPTHDVIIRYWPPPEFERNLVAFDEGQLRDLEEALVLKDAISDLPTVETNEVREVMLYDKPPETEFQKYMRTNKSVIFGSGSYDTLIKTSLLYDHRPYSLNEDDYARVCLIPKRKGANFRDLPGVIVRPDNIVERDPKAKDALLPSGKPVVPDFALNYEKGKSKRPYARLWWDETVSTVVTYPDLHSMAILHPEQDRVLTLRECARLQGFPDFYRFCGSIKDRYRQVGNAVAVSVGRALGYTLGMAIQKLNGNEPLMKLPAKFSYATNLQQANSFTPET